MMHSQMVATVDGGVIVLCGMKLYKYDKNLILKKEVDLPCVKDDGDEKEGMGMMEHCPPHKPMPDSSAKKAPAGK